MQCDGCGLEGGGRCDVCRHLYAATKKFYEMVAHHLAAREGWKRRGNTLGFYEAEDRMAKEAKKKLGLIE